MIRVSSAFVVLWLAVTSTLAQGIVQREKVNDTRNICPEEWRPVCARTRQDIVITYPNDCYARLDGAVKISDESCSPIEITSGGCHAFYRPVCARAETANSSSQNVPTGGANPKIRPYFNRCYADEAAKKVAKQNNDAGAAAKTAKVLITYSEIKATGILDFDKVCPSICPQTQNVVCAKDAKENNRLYLNKCTAIADGAQWINNQDKLDKLCDRADAAPEAPDPPLPIADGNQPVCARTSKNIFLTYRSEKYAQFDNATLIHSDDCRSGPAEVTVRWAISPCYALYEPVCARFENAKKEKVNLAFLNKCFAAEAKATILIDYSEIQSRTLDWNKVCPKEKDDEDRKKEKQGILITNKYVCPDKVDLVCGRDSDGKYRLFRNRCAAALEGAEWINNGPCRY